MILATARLSSWNKFKKNGRTDVKKSIMNHSNPHFPPTHSIGFPQDGSSSWSKNNLRCEMKQTEGERKPYA